MNFLAFLPLLVIDINIDPTIGELGPFTLTWHGLFTAIGIIAGVSLSVWLAKKDGIPSEVGQEIALVGVPSAIVGARLFYCFEHWDNFSSEPQKILTGITEGGITLYGGLIGGVVGGLIYTLIHNRNIVNAANKVSNPETRARLLHGRWPIGIALDAAAPGMVLGQALGRVGDLINGEHHADETSLPWAVRYIHPNTLGELGKAVHPTAGGYELLGDLIICLLLVFVARRFLRAPGWTFCAYVILYGAMRFALSFTRTNTGAGGEQELFNVPVPQLTAFVTVGLAVIAAAVLLKYPGGITREWADRVGWERVDPDPEPEPAG